LTNFDYNFDYKVEYFFVPIVIIELGVGGLVAIYINKKLNAKNVLNVYNQNRMR